MDLFDAGRTQPEIVAETGMAPIWVKQIVRAYDYASIWSNSARFERNARIACAAHASAIAATGRSYA